MDKAQAIDNFWSSFGWEAYHEASVPEKGEEEAKFPYITYMFSEDDFDHPLYIEASLWDRGTSWRRITEKTKEISENIGYGGKIIKIDEGYIWIQRGRPFAQRIADDNDMIRRVMINIDVEYMTRD